MMEYLYFELKEIKNGYEITCKDSISPRGFKCVMDAIMHSDDVENKVIVTEAALDYFINRAEGPLKTKLRELLDQLVELTKQISEQEKNEDEIKACQVNTAFFYKNNIVS